MKIIMISAKSQHGKDTVAKLMREHLEASGKKVLIMHFADLVKHYAYDYWQWNGEKDEAGRALLQKIGTTIMRKYWPTYWAEIIAKFINAVNYFHIFDYILIPDWRFINEFETICQYNELVTTIRVERYNEDGTYYKNPHMTTSQYLHISECQLDNFPFEWVIENCGSLSDLKNSVNFILEHI